MIGNNNLFNNPFDVSKQNETDIGSLYAKLEALKNSTGNKTVSQTRNVYTDISEELNKLTTDEKKYLEEDAEYQVANLEHQTAFTSFLLENFGNDFLKSKYGQAPEKLLNAIRKTKDKFRSELTNDINTIKEQNELLIKQNTELSKHNEEMNALVSNLQKQLFGTSNDR